MIKVDLVTGFLGAGKTTFIRGYVDYLKRRGQHIRIIENEFGEESVDTKLLDDDIEVSDLAGLCMCCVGKEAFIKMLLSSAEEGCDRIIVEPSGIYDVDEFFEVLSLPKIAEKCEIGTIITIVDLMELEYLLDEAQYLLFTQVLASGIVVISKTDLLVEGMLEDGIDKLNELMEEYGCESGVLAEIMARNLSMLTDDDFDEISDTAYLRLIHDREEFDHNEVFKSAVVGASFEDGDDIRHKILDIFESPSCGRVYRIKGFKKAANGKNYEINCTPETIRIAETDVTDDMLVVIGQQLRIADIEEKLG